MEPKSEFRGSLMEVGMVAIEEWHKADSIGGPDQDLGNGYSSRQE